MQSLSPARLTESETLGLGHSNLFSQALQMTLMPPEFENLCTLEVSKYLNDRIRSGHAGGLVNNGPEGKKLKSGRPEESSEGIGSLG